MKIPRSLIFIFLAGPHAACLAEGEASLPEAPEGDPLVADEVVNKLAEVEQATNAAAAAAASAQEAAASLEEMVREKEVQEKEQEEEEEEEEDEDEDEDEEEEIQVGGDEEEEEAEDSTDEEEDERSSLEDQDEDAHEDGWAGDAAELDVEVEAVDALKASAFDADYAESDAEEEFAEVLEGVDANPGEGMAAAAVAAAEKAFGGAAARFDGFIDGWRDRGEGNSWKGAVVSYDELLEEHYLKMSFGQATALGVVGDTIAQRLERRRNPGQRYEFKRTVHAGLLNMLIDGVFTPHWYNLVDYINDEMTLAVSVVKAVAASVLYSPFANGLFLAGAWVLSYGMKAGFGWREWKRQLAVCTIRDLEMWPPLHILNFWLVPKHWRPLAGHLAGVFLLAVISTTGLTDAALPLGQRTAPLLMRWARAIGDRLTGKGRRAAGAPPAQRG